MNKRVHLYLLVGLLLSSNVLFAQEAAQDPFDTAKMRIGSVALTPKVSVAKLGIDTNVMNSWTNPESDFTATPTASADAWLRFGKARLSVHGEAGYLFFATHDDQSGVNTNNSARLDIPLLRIRPYVGGSYMSVRDRPGYEIDLRVRRQESGLLAGVDLPVGARTTLGASYRALTTRYEDLVSINEISLSVLFDRTTNMLTGSARYALTPLTTLVLDVDWVQEQFKYSTIRNSTGLRVLPGIEFGKFALITGTARVGFRQLNMETSTMPSYSGPVAKVNLGYTVLGTTHFDFAVDRDVVYSFEVAQPFYLLTGITLTTTQAIRGPWDVQLRGGLQWLAYQRASAANLISTTGRTDAVGFYGLGVGYKLGPDTRLGVNVDDYTRRSDVDTRQYHGLRVTSSVTYGF